MENFKKDYELFDLRCRVLEEERQEILISKEAKTKELENSKETIKVLNTERQ
jgi:hypothetical protein